MRKNHLRIISIVIWLILNLIPQLLPISLAKPKIPSYNLYYSTNNKTSKTAKYLAVTQNNSLSPINISTDFVYPIGKPGYITQAKDGDGWYNARDFREVNHLGEDWNAETGGNTDCGLPVRAISNGKIVFAGTNIEGWGNVLIIRHLLPDGRQVESLYGHLKSFTKTSGDVGIREIIGLIGDGGGLYSCHLHLEIRFSNCPSWGTAGLGYSLDAKGWTDPSSFIDSYLKHKLFPKSKNVTKNKKHSSK